MSQHTAPLPITRSTPAVPRPLRPLALLIAGLVLIKFLGLAAKHGISDAPWLVLPVLFLPFVVGSALLTARPRAGAAMLLPFALLLAAIASVKASQGLEPYWGDYLLAYVGGPAAAVVAVAALRVLVSSRSTTT